MGVIVESSLRSMMNRVSRFALLPMIVAGGLAVAGCGGAAEAPKVASVGGAPSIAPTADVVAAYVEGVRAWVTCLRGEGLKVSDPDTKGRFEFEGDTLLLKKDPKFAAAQTKCMKTHPLPTVPDGLEEKPVLTAEQIEKARQYAKCMRENGAPDFPDPGPDGHFPDDNGNDGGKPLWDSGTDAALRATRICEQTVYGVTPGPGRG
jgi:hypothetical protein